MVNKFSNTKAYMASFSDKLIKLLRLELRNAKRRKSKYGEFYGSPIEYTGSLSQSLSKVYKKGSDGFNFNIEGNSYGLELDEGS